MRKIVFALLAITLMFGTFASAQVAIRQTQASAVIDVHATIQQSASISLDKGIVNFDVTDPKATTNGGTVVATGNVSMAKGHYAQFVIEGGELVGSKDGGSITDHIYVVAGGTPTPQQVNVGGLYYGLNYAANGGAQTLTFPMTFTLAPVEGFVPDEYNGTVTVTLYVV